MIPKAYWAYISVLGSKISPKNNSTPIKPLEYSIITHEDEEWQHDPSKLQEKLHQISLSQRVAKNEMEVLKKGVEANMDGLKKCMEAKMDGMEAGMEAKMDDMEEIGRASCRERVSSPV